MQTVRRTSSLSRLAAIVTPFWRTAILHLACFIGITVVLYGATANHLFRSEQWLIYNVFNDLGWSLRDLQQVATFEMFGGIRFQPLAHLMMYAQYKLFGANPLLHHLIQMALHVTVIFIVYLILIRLTRNQWYAFLFGILFATLFSQYDIVNWTYHVYIIVGTAASLIAILLVFRHIEKPRASILICGIISAVIAAFIYEPFLAVLPVLGLILIVHYFFYARGSRPLYKSGIRTYIILTVSAAAIYISAFLYVFRISSHVITTSEIFSVGNLLDATKLVFANFLRSTLGQNSGYPLNSSIWDIVHINETVVLKGGLGILTLIPCILLVLSYKPDRKAFRYVVPFMLIAFINLFIISTGRASITGAEYVPAQPRYQYLANTMLVLSLGVLFWTPGRRKMAQAFLVCCVLVIASFNALNVYHGNQSIDKAMRPLTQYYQQVLDYFQKQPTGVLFVDFSTTNGNQLSLGSDIAFDVLFYDSNRITKSVKKANDIFYNYGITKNPAYSPLPLAREVGDFTVEWTYLQVPDKLRKGIVVIGSETDSPKIWINSDGRLELYVIDIISGKSETFVASEKIPSGGKWTRIAVDKEGDSISFIVNGIVTDRFSTHSKYRRWQGDNRELLGQFYRGAAETAYVLALKIKLDESEYHSRSLGPGQDLFWQITPGW
jgi:hypothetical protein